LEALVYSSELQQRLVAAGHGRTALVLRLLGQHHEAWDTPHLTCSVRTRRMHAMHTLVRRMLLPQLDDADLMATFATRTTKRLGTTTELLFVYMANIEARQQLLQAVPGAAVGLAERSLSTDDIENEFSLVVNGCGFKPTVEVCMGFLEHLDFLYMLRRNPRQHGISMVRSSKSAYSYQTSIAQRDRTWNDGLYLSGTEAGLAALDRHRARTEDRACNVLALKRDRSVRSYHRVQKK
jgi:hypothetical protein